MVTISEDVSGDSRLVAYVVAKQQPPPTLNDLRSFLKLKLPDYMVPSSFVFLDRLPLTPNGKVDRKASPLLDRARIERAATDEIPENETEKALAAIWMELLGIDQVGIHDNFFELGGHSLLATRVVTRVQARIGVEVPLRVMFDCPTLAEFALAIVAKQAAETGESALNIVIAKLEEAIPQLEASAE
jgi:surfactin family lipopeptide synthetase A